MKNNSVLLVDDHPMFRKGVIDLIELEDDLSVIGEVSNGEEAIKKAVHESPNVILLDLNMKGMSGLETLRALRNAGVNSRIIVFSGSDAEDDVLMALRAGADGYLLKGMESENLVGYIRLACEGKMVLSEDLLPVVAMVFRDEKCRKKTDIDCLTRREKQILKCIAAGLSNKMISKELNIAEATVKVHIKNIFKKLELTSRVEAAVWVVENQLTL